MKKGRMKRGRYNYSTMRLWNKTRRTLRMLSALKGRPMVEVMDVLATRELKRMEQSVEGIGG